MDPNWIAAVVAVFTLIVTLLSVLIGKFFSLSKELALLRTHVAETYSTKNEVKDLAVRVERQMETGFNRIYETLNKRDTA